MTLVDISPTTIYREMQYCGTICDATLHVITMRDLMLTLYFIRCPYFCHLLIPCITHFRRPFTSIRYTGGHYTIRGQSSPRGGDRQRGRDGVQVRSRAGTCRQASPSVSSRGSVEVAEQGDGRPVYREIRVQFRPPSPPCLVH